MPYASREDLPISEERFRRLASDLSHTTAKNYAYYLLNYPDRARENSLWASAQRMIDGQRSLKPEERFRHVEAIERHLKSRGTGSSDRRNRWFAIKSFHEYHRLSLPRLQRIEASKAFEPYEMDKSRAVALKPLKVGR